MLDFPMTPELPLCSSPLIFEYDNEEYPYGMAGTGFLAKSNDRYYFITAKHCLRKGDHNKLRVPVVLGDSDLIELKTFGDTKVPESEEDTDYADFSIFSISESFEPSQCSNALTPAFIPASDTTGLLNSKIWLTVRGFPHEVPGNFIDYERKHISNQAVQCDAKYIKSAESKFTHELKFIESCIKNVNGMSGAPVFAKLPKEGMIIYILVGIMLRAKRFLSIEVIKEGIRNFEAE